MQNIKIKKIYSLLFLLVLSLFVFLFSLHLQNFNAEINSIYLKASLVQPAIRRKSITLMFVGDIMLNRGVEYTVEKYGNGDFKFPFLKIRSYLQEADILFGNLESVISDKGTKVGSVYSFRADPDSIDGLTYAGFDILSVANNHVFDYGREAMKDSFLRLKESGIDYIGGGFDKKEAYSAVIREIEGTKIAFLAFTNLGIKYWSAEENRSGIAWLTAENLEKEIKKTNEKADLVIVSMHFGEEYKSSPTPEQVFFAQLAIDTGANLVVGHHPHVVQEIEEHNGGYIAYSLGNFVFDQSFSEETMKGLLLKVVVENNKIKEVIPIEIEINKFFQPQIMKK